MVGERRHKARQGKCSATTSSCVTFLSFPGKNRQAVYIGIQRLFSHRPPTPPHTLITAGGIALPPLHRLYTPASHWQAGSLPGSSTASGSTSLYSRVYRITERGMPSRPVLSTVSHHHPESSHLLPSPGGIRIEGRASSKVSTPPLPNTLNVPYPNHQELA